VAKGMSCRDVTKAVDKGEFISPSGVCIRKCREWKSRDMHRIMSFSQKNFNLLSRPKRLGYFRSMLTHMFLLAVCICVFFNATIIAFSSQDGREACIYSLSS